MTTMANMSSKYWEIISNSTLISRSTITTYQLKPNKKEMGTLTLHTVGERDPSMSNKTILLVGETGTGKSTLINALFNHMIGVTWDDKIWFQIVEEEQRSQSESQTSDVIVYQIFGFEGKPLPFSLSIIDTPGYNDTRGIDRDVLIDERLLALFRMKKGIREVDIVGLVMKASECRLSDHLRYAFNSMMSLFGKDLEKNIVALVTHSNGVTPENVFQAMEEAKIKCAKNEENEPVHFLFDNLQKTERKMKNERALKNSWEVTETGIQELMTFMKETEPQKLDKTVQVLNERIRLTACIQNLQDRIEYTELKQKEIQQIKKAVNQQEGGMEQNQNFEVEVDEPYKEKEDVSGGMFFFMYSGATCCLRCEETCHYPGCTVTWYPSGCEVMKNNQCTVCRGKCPVDCHVKEEWRYVTKTRKVKKTNAIMKEMYEKFNSEKDKYSNLLDFLMGEDRQMMEEKRRLLDEAYKHVMSLKQLALSINAVSTFIDYDFLIEKMRERGDEAKAKELEEMKSQAEQENKSRVGHVWRQLKGMIPKGGANRV